MLSAQTILELQEILCEEFSYKTPTEEASEIAAQLMYWIEELAETNNESPCQTANTK